MNIECSTGAGTPIVIPSIPSPFTTVEGATLWAQILTPGLVEGPFKKSEKFRRSTVDEVEREKELKQTHIKLYYKEMYDQVTSRQYSNKMRYREDKDLKLRTDNVHLKFCASMCMSQRRK